MSEGAPHHDEEMLARLAEFDLAAAERVHGRLMAAEEAAELAELGRTYQRLARSLRQTLALKAKLKRDREAAARDLPPTAPAPPGGVAVARRIRELRQAVTRVIWDEAEDAEHVADLEDLLEDTITREMLRDRFCAETSTTTWRGFACSSNCRPKAPSAGETCPTRRGRPKRLPGRRTRKAPRREQAGRPCSSRASRANDARARAGGDPDACTECGRTLGPGPDRNPRCA